MTMRFRPYLLLSALTVLAVSNMPTHAADNAAVIKNAMSAAPDAVATNATIATFDDKMQMADGRPTPDDLQHDGAELYLSSDRRQPGHDSALRDVSRDSLCAPHGARETIAGIS